jgi:NADH-quinone oxidoreductase subunit J
MNSSITLVVANLLLATGAYCLLPHRHGRARPWVVNALGALLAAAGVVVFASLWTPPFTSTSAKLTASQLFTEWFFYALGATALSAAIMTVVSRNPVHNALWFAVVLLATSGLFLLVDAQFLAAGTVIVYAGAIVVTFLFVIMLAQSEGNALYDRMARAPLVSCLTAFLLVASITYAVCTVRDDPAVAVRYTPQQLNRLSKLMPQQEDGLGPDKRLARLAELSERAQGPQGPAARAVLARWDGRIPATDPAGRNATPAPHVAGLGQALYSDHLIAIEAVGALLFVALVGAAAIGTPRSAAAEPTRPGTTA